MKKTTAFLLSVVIAIVGSLYTFPALLHFALDQTERIIAGFVTKQVSVDGLNIVYFEGGDKGAETILLIHGFGGSKEHWSRFAKPLNDRYHVIAVDLPGFGDSDKPEQIHYDAGSQMERLEHFLARIDVKQAHVLGNSMGGHIAALLAARHPDRVQSLALFDNAGIITFPLSEVYTELLNGKNPLLVHDQQDFARLMQLLFDKPPRIPARLQQYLAERAIADSSRNARIFNQYLARYSPLEAELFRIKAPTLILWGEQDRVINRNTIEVMQGLLTDTEVKITILPNCGHVPMIERPAEAAQRYLLFLHGLSPIRHEPDTKIPDAQARDFYRNNQPYKALVSSGTASNRSATRP